MLESRTAPSPRGIVSAKASYERRDNHLAAAAAAAFLTGKVLTDHSWPMPRDIGLLKAILWDCSTPPPRIRIRDLLHDVAVFVNPQLPASAASEVWSAVRSAPCANAMSKDDQLWLELIESVGARDAQMMAQLARQVAEGSKDLRNSKHMRTYALIAGSTGLLVLGRGEDAGRFLDWTLAKLPTATIDEPVILALRGYVRRNGLARQ